MSSFFIEGDEIVDVISREDPDMRHVECGERSNIQGRNVSWYAESPYVVWIDAEKILFMDGNLWRASHAAGIAQGMRDGCSFEPPAGRVHRLDAAAVKSTQDAAKRGDLEGHNMVRPYTKRDIGTYYAQLIDGNHRAAAAMVLGESRIPVYVGENYRSEIRKKDWIKLRRA